MNHSGFRFRLKIGFYVGLVVYLSLVSYNLVQIFFSSILIPGLNPMELTAQIFFLVTATALPSVILISSILGYSLTPLARVVAKLENRQAIVTEERVSALKNLESFSRRMLIFVGTGYLIGFSIRVIPAFGTPRLGEVALAMVPSMLVAGIALIILIPLSNAILEKPRSLLRIHSLSDFGVLPRQGSYLFNSVVFTLAQTSFVLYAMVFNLFIFIRYQILYTSSLQEAITGAKSSIEAGKQFFNSIAAILDLTLIYPEGFTIVDFTPNYPLLILTTSILFLLFIGLSATLMYLFGRHRDAQMKDLVKSLQLLAEAKSTQLLDINNPDEIGQVSDRVNALIISQSRIFKRLEGAGLGVMRFSNKLDAVISESRTSAENFIFGAEKINSTTREQSEILNTTNLSYQQTSEQLGRIISAIQDQVMAVNDTSSAVQEMAASIGSVYNTTQNAKQLSTNLSKTASTGFKSVTTGINSIKDIEKASSEIRKLVGGIAKISSQTNLLAMNAAIEAAHAGEAGRGFAVVSEEVRNLATSSGNLTKKITSKIQDMLILVENSARVSEEAGESLKTISQDIEKTVQMVSEIASAMNEQNAGTQMILQNITALVNSSSDIREVADKAAAVNSTLQADMERLIKGFDEIRSVTETQVMETQAIEASSKKLVEIASENKRVINDLEETIRNAAGGTAEGICE